ncbi:MAG: lamin tail domain-containing protein [Clostridia bacterium]|nr:lamin tail domain-containing protein [Clostridia bacterium]
MKKKRLVYILCLCLFVALAAVLGLALNRCASEAGASGAGLSGFPVYINEIMSSNGSYYDEHGNSYDWIELFNSSDIAVSLNGYKLTDTERSVRHVFPADAAIEPGGYYVVWCKRNETAAGYADFSISKAGGEALVLMNARSIVIDRVVTVPLAADEVMARGADGEWTTLPYGTPGYENSEAG